MANSALLIIVILHENTKFSEYFEGAVSLIKNMFCENKLISKVAVQ